MRIERRVLLIFDTNIGYDRRVLGGVGHYARLNPAWAFRSYSPWETDLIRRLVETWHPTGIISCFQKWDADLFPFLIKTGIPAVQVDGLERPTVVPQIYTDGKAIVELVADYMIKRGIRSFGYVGGSQLQDVRRIDVFRELAQQGGFAFESFHGEIRGENDPAGEFNRWLRERSLPTALLASSDWVGWHVINSCLGAGFRVPDDFAVMGIADDHPWTDLAPVPLSSVAVAAENIGYRAASLLDQMMHGQEVSRDPIVIPPVGIVARRSTDIIAAEDPDMALVLRFIHNHAAEGCTVKEVLQEVPMDRRRMERWFRQNLGRSPRETIQMLRIAHVMKMLAETDERMEEIASRCGFRTAKLLSRAFRRETGQTLLRYRSQFRRAARDPKT